MNTSRCRHTSPILARLLQIVIVVLLINSHLSVQAEEPYRVPLFSCIKSIDTTAAPNMVSLCPRVAELADQCYPKIKAFLGDNAKVPDKIAVVFSDKTGSGTWYDGSTIYLSAPWLEKHPEDIGCFVFSLAGLMPKYTGPGWLVTGMADYWRYIEFKLPGADGTCGVCKPQETYQAGFQCAAAFLNWIQNTYDHSLRNKLNDVLTSDSYTDAFWTKCTGKSVDILWAEYSKQSQNSMTGDVAFYRQFVRSKVNLGWQHNIHQVPIGALKDVAEIKMAVQFQIDHAGNVSDVKITKSSGIPLLDKALTDAAIGSAPLLPIPASMLGYKNFQMDLPYTLHGTEDKTQGQLSPELAASQNYDLGVQKKREGLCEQSRAALLLAIKLDKNGPIATRAATFLKCNLPIHPVPPDAEQGNIRAFNMQMRNDSTGAKEAYTDLIQRFPLFEWPYSNLASIYTKEGDGKKAIDLAQQALAINPNYVHAWCQLAQAQLVGNDCFAAQESIKQAVQLDPDDPAIKMASMLLDLKKRELLKNSI